MRTAQRAHERSETSKKRQVSVAYRPAMCEQQPHCAGRDTSTCTDQDIIKEAAGPVMLLLRASRRCLFTCGSNPKRFHVAAISVAAAGM